MKRLGIEKNIILHYDEIPEIALDSAVNYRSEVYAAYPRRNPNHYARKTLAKRIGVSSRTTQNYDKRAGLIVIPRYSKKQISRHDIDQFPNERTGVITIELIIP